MDGTNPYLVVALRCLSGRCPVGRCVLLRRPRAGGPCVLRAADFHPPTEYVFFGDKCMFNALKTWEACLTIIV